jgi:hypothetical protein
VSPTPTKSSEMTVSMFGIRSRWPLACFFQLDTCYFKQPLQKRPLVEGQNSNNRCLVLHNETRALATPEAALASENYFHYHSVAVKTSPDDTKIT